MSRLPHLLPLLGMLNEIIDLVGKVIGIAIIDKKTILTVSNDAAWTVITIKGYCWDTTRHCLDEYQSKGLPTGGANQKVTIQILGVNIRRRGMEGDISQVES